MDEKKQIEEMAKTCPYNVDGECALDETRCTTSCEVAIWGHSLVKSCRKQSEWISVDERLPHSQQIVICYTPCDGYMFVGFYQKVVSPYWKSYWNIITSMRSTKKITKKVTHWMSLPEPPKKGGAE